MDIVAIRLLSVAGLAVLGVLAALLGLALARLAERVSSLRGQEASRPFGTSGARPAVRAFWFERSAARRL
jgi:hypothetical protein